MKNAFSRHSALLKAISASVIDIPPQLRNTRSKLAANLGFVKDMAAQLVCAERAQVHLLLGEGDMKMADKLDRAGTIKDLTIECTFFAFDPREEFEFECFFSVKRSCFRELADTGFMKNQQKKYEAIGWICGFSVSYYEGFVLNDLLPEEPCNPFCQVFLWLEKPGIKNLSGDLVSGIKFSYWHFEDEIHDFCKGWFGKPVFPPSKN